MSDQAPVQPETFVLEKDRRLSDSLLWRAQRAYFDATGIDAWRRNTVPHYVTNNPALARAYAQVVFGFLRDLTRTARLDRSAPLYVLELGAGAGRFGFLFLKKLLEHLDASPLRGIDVRYVLSDFTPSNVAFYESHRSLRPFFERGVLESALFDCEADRSVTLRRSGVTLAPGSLRNPLVVISNYVFDGLPQDAFCIHEGTLHESLVTVSAPTPEVDLTRSDPFAPLNVSYRLEPASPEPYAEPEVNEILRSQVARGGKGTFLLPVTAIACVSRLAELAGARLLLLGADWDDQGDGSRPPGEPSMAIHGSFSLGVSFDAIGRLFEARGGHVVRTGHRPRHLHVGAFALEGAGDLAETRLAFATAIDRGGPDDLFSIRQSVAIEGMDVAQVLASIRLWDYDPKLLQEAITVLPTLTSDVPESRKRDLVRAVRLVWENYYPMGEPRDLALELAGLLYGVGAYADALELGRESLALWGESPQAHWNVGLCRLALRDTRGAVESMDRAFALDPGFRPVGAFQRKP